MTLIARVVLFIAAVAVPIVAVWASFLTARGWLGALVILAGAACSAFCILALVNEAREDGYDHGRRQSATHAGYADRGDGWGDER